MGHKGLYIWVIILLVCSCNNKTTQYFNPEELCGRISMIDSLNNEVIAEQKDSPTNVVDPITGEKYSEQEVLASWQEDKEQWDIFVGLCMKHKFAKARKMLCDIVFHANVLGHLRTPDVRYYFIKKIADPLILEYESDLDEIINQYVMWREEEFMIENALLKASDTPEQIITDHYLDMVRELGYGYVHADRFDEAMDLAYIIRTITQVLTGEDLAAEFSSYLYMGQLYKQFGDIESANDLMMFFRDSVLLNYTVVGCPEYNEICKVIDNQLQ